MEITGFETIEIIFEINNFEKFKYNIIIIIIT